MRAICARECHYAAMRHLLRHVFRYIAQRDATLLRRYD